MNSKHLQQLLILLIICLVCSITPATAIQNNHIQTNNNGDNWIGLFNKTYTEDMTKLLNGFDEASNTELTPEQDTYLETHEPTLLIKAETILYNLQTFLNILLTEYYTKNTTTQSENEGNNENNLDKYNCTEVWCTLEELNKREGVKPRKMNETVKFYNSNMIIHVKDPKCDYMEFVGFISMDDKTIKYQKGKNIIDCSWENFTKEYPPTHNNSNISRYSVTTFNCSTQLALECMYVEKRDKLIGGRTNLDNGRWICGIFAVSGGVAVAVAGVYRLCDYCNSQTRQKITEIIEHPEEITPLVQPNGLVKTYTRITEEVHNNQYCNKCTIGIGIVTCGTLILIGSVIGFILCSKGIDTCNRKLECLKEYCPLTYC